MSSICAVVVSLPERHNLLVEALGSIHGQTRKPDDVVVGIDPRHYGEAGNMNRLMRATDCEWVAFLHDDDLWLPEHLAVAERFFDVADVIVARFELVGRDHIEAWHDDFRDLRFTNWFWPSCVVARKDAWGDWVDKGGRYCWVDWANFNRVLDSGARFVDTKTVTAVYRFGLAENGSWRAPALAGAPGWNFTGR